MAENQGQRSTGTPDREGTEEQWQVSTCQGGQGQGSQVMVIGTVACDSFWEWNVAGQPPSRAQEWRRSQEPRSLVQQSLVPTLNHACDNRGDSDMVPDLREPTDPQWWFNLILMDGIHLIAQIYAE